MMAKPEQALLEIPKYARPSKFSELQKLTVILSWETLKHKGDAIAPLLGCCFSKLTLVCIRPGSLPSA